MLIRSREVGILPPAPEFARDGSWPPVTTDWLPLRLELFDAETSSLAAFTAHAIITEASEDNANPLLEEDILRSTSSYESAFSKIWVALNNRKSEYEVLYSDDPEKLITYFTGYGKLSNRSTGKELRRLTYSARWKRKDPIIQLPPGSTHEVTYSITTGLSMEHSQTLARSLGVSVGESLSGLQAKLNSQLDKEFGFKLDLTTQEERSTKLTLANQDDDHYYKLFALWHVDHRITVDALELPADKEFTKGLQPIWTPRGAVQFIESGDPFITYTRKCY